MNENRIKHKTLFKLAVVATGFTVVVVVLGAFTRLADAGLGCPDWPGCYGHLLWPNESHEIIAAEEAFPHAPVELDKTWPEMVHRYFAGTLGLIILSLFILCLRQRQTAPVKHAAGLLALVIVQAAFGMWTVTLKLWPQVVTAHLLGGFATLSLLWLLVHRLGQWQWSFSPAISQQLIKLKPLLILGLVLVILQIALGGWMSSNYAALACPDFPQCLGQWWPPADFRQGFDFFHQTIGPNYLGGELDNHARTAIHMGHRIGAIVVFAYLLWLGLRLYTLGESKVRQWVLVLWAALLLQVLLGISNVIFQLPLAVAVAHNAGGAVLLLSVIVLLHRISTIKNEVNAYEQLPEPVVHRHMA